ncbi:MULTISPECIES: hypothetical protein [Haloferax]|nr:hypothetical protein [Haloferax mediterranei]MDX5987730.1 hypothetical protein [Haloferax mediterranei ATCC 33500]
MSRTSAGSPPPIPVFDDDSRVETVAETAKTRDRRSTGVPLPAIE